MLPKLHEEAMALPSEEESPERKRPEQPALATFAMPDVPLSHQRLLNRQLKLLRHQKLLNPLLHLLNPVY